MRRAGGYRVISEPGKADIENDTFTCAHGNEIVVVPPGMPSVTVGAFCRACMGHICEKCAAEMEKTLKCTPFEKRLEAAESRKRFRSALTE